MDKEEIDDIKSSIASGKIKLVILKLLTKKTSSLDSFIHKKY